MVKRSSSGPMAEKLEAAYREALRTGGRVVNPRTGRPAKAATLAKYLRRRSAIAKKAPAKTKSLRVVCISDTHMRHASLRIPDGDVLVHAGDFVDLGAPMPVGDQLRNFKAWLSKLPHSRKLVALGNHEKLARHESGKAALFTPGEMARALSPVAEVVDYGLLSIGGVHFGVASFGSARRAAQLAGSCDVLITHTPPQGILDCPDPQHAGSPAVLEASRSAAAHVFGHCHDAPGTHVRGKTLYVNASGDPVCFVVSPPSRPAVLC